MRRLILQRLQVQARVGILDHELLRPQLLVVTVTVELPHASPLPASDDIDQVFDYCRLRDVAIEETKRDHVNLLETLAGRIAQRLLAYPQVGRTIVRIDKPGIFTDCDSIGVEIDIVKGP